jgi:cellulose synthase/poly-beta-1,6-N-acetylglucosamine synthase-like glycosyltransferase
MPETLPFVTVVVPCRNEEKFIAGCLDSIISSDYPKDRLEVFVVDGMSEDATREILAGYTSRYEYIKMLENTKRITPCAFNLGIKNARGDIIVIMGMHASYAGDYISKSVRYLEEYGVDNVGGVWATVPRDNTLIGKAIAQALSHRFGVGNSVFRTGAREPVLVDTVFGGCYRKAIFEKIGLFNEKLVRHQDMELNCRLRAAGGRILLAPDIVCQYYARTDIKSFLKHNFSNGQSIFSALKDSSVLPFSVRHLIPLIFVASLAVSAALSIFSPVFAWLLSAIICSYLLAALYFSVKICRDSKDPKLILAMPIAFALLHVSHGLGALKGVLRLLVSKRFWSCHIFAACDSPARLK